MRPLWRVALDAAGRGRAALVVGTTALVSGLLLVAASVLRLPGGVRVDPSGGRFIEELGLLGVLEDPGLRPGVVFGIALCCVPLLLLLDQAVRLGSADRRRRVAALRVAGATRRDLARMGAVEIGVPAVAGALLGVVVWALLRQVLGVALLPRQAAVVPVGTGPGGWTPVVLAGVAAYGVVTGLRAGSRAATLDRAGGPRGTARPPRAWGLLWLAASAAVLVVSVVGYGRVPDATAFGGLALLVLALATLAPWVAHAVAGLVALGARSPALLLAARRLQVDARPAGRAAAAVGAVALTLGVAGGFVAETSRTQYDAAFYVVPALLVAGLAVVAAVLVAASLAVHTTETVLDRRRQLATLVAVGVPVDVVSRSQRLECLLATVPLAVVSAVVGGFGYLVLADAVGTGALGAAVGVLVAVGTVAGAVTLATRLLRPWVESALGPEALRTE